MIKPKQLFTNLVRNRNSKVYKLVLSNNDFEMYDFNEMLKIIDEDSVFGDRQHFKLRFLALSNCPNLSPFEFKMKSRLDEFYSRRKRKTFISYMSK